MKVDIKPNQEKSEVELKISASADDFAPYVKDAAKKLSKEKSIKGFRPGKAPVEVVEEVFGTGRLLNEAMDRAIPRFFIEAVLDMILMPLPARRWLLRKLAETRA